MKGQHDSTRYTCIYAQPQRGRTNNPASMVSTAKALPLDLALPVAIKAGTGVLGFLQNITQSQPERSVNGSASGDKLSVLS